MKQFKNEHFLPLSYCLRLILIMILQQKNLSRLNSFVFTGRKHKIRKDDTVRTPRSLFDRPSAALLKLRREAKLAKLKQGIFRTPAGLKLPSLPSADIGADQPEWLIHEDWALLQVSKLQMCRTLFTVN